MVMFLAVMATTPPINTRLSLWGHLWNLLWGCCVCNWCVPSVVRGNKGVYSDRGDAMMGGKITAINIKHGDTFISQIRVR